MKRLISRKLLAITNGALEDLQIDITPSKAEELIPLKTLDSAQVKSNKCPNCKYSPLDKMEGYHVCKNCGYAYKVFDNKVYIVE